MLLDTSDARTKMTSTFSAARELPGTADARSIEQTKAQRDRRTAHLLTPLLKLPCTSIIFADGGGSKDYRAGTLGSVGASARRGLASAQAAVLRDEFDAGGLKRRGRRSVHTQFLERRC